MVDYGGGHLCFAVVHPVAPAHSPPSCRPRATAADRVDRLVLSTHVWRWPGGLIWLWIGHAAAGRDSVTVMPMDSQAVRPRWLCAAEDVMPVMPDDLELFLAPGDLINDAGLREELHELPSS